MLPMDDRIKGIEAGADDFISKPFNKAELLARVKSLLRMKQPTARKDETMVLDMVLADLTEGVVVTDGQWKIKNINRAAQELLNIHETDSASMDLLAHLSHMNLSVPADMLMSTQEKIVDFQIMPSDPQRPFHASARMAKIFDEQGNIVGFTVIVRKMEKK